MRVPVCLVGIGELVSRTSRQASVGDGWCCGLRWFLNVVGLRRRVAWWRPTHRQPQRQVLDFLEKK